MRIAPAKSIHIVIVKVAQSVQEQRAPAQTDTAECGNILAKHLIKAYNEAKDKKDDERQKVYKNVASVCNGFDEK